MSVAGVDIRGRRSETGTESSRGSSTTSAGDVDVWHNGQFHSVVNFVLQTGLPVELSCDSKTHICWQCGLY